MSLLDHPLIDHRAGLHQHPDRSVVAARIFEIENCPGECSPALSRQDEAARGDARASDECGGRADDRGSEGATLSGITELEAS